MQPGITYIFLCCLVGCWADQLCYNAMKQQCASNNEFVPVCTSSYGNFPVVASTFQMYANTHLARSMQALMIGKHFTNYEFSRKGFHDFFMTLSEDLFEDAIGLIRFLNDRGSSHDFGKCVPHDETRGNYELYELEALTWALDVQKKIAQDAVDINKLVGGSDQRYADADASYYLQSNFASKHHMKVRSFARNYVQVEKMLTSNNQMLVLYEFDDFLNCIVNN